MRKEGNPVKRGWGDRGEESSQASEAEWHPWMSTTASVSLTTSHSPSHATISQRSSGARAISWKNGSEVTESARKKGLTQKMKTNFETKCGLTFKHVVPQRSGDCKHATNAPVQNETAAVLHAQLLCFVRSCEPLHFLGNIRNRYAGVADLCGRRTI
jgi:hypothetical protein